MSSRTKATTIINRFRSKAIAAWDYCAHGVWQDSRSSFGVNSLKTLNLAVKSFLDTDLQIRAAALTYNTMLAIVPALALLFAVARGFGFSKLLKTQLFQALPSQSQALTEAFKYADSYLSHASQGVFVGIGLVFLLWTMISLMSTIENTMNRIWGVPTNRPIRRKVIDYTAIMFLLPILMVVASGLSILASTMFVDNPNWKILTPALKTILDIIPFVLTWVAFTGLYMIFPNTKVKWKTAALSGILAGTAFQLLQYLFMTGQIYVSKYNAIYGSFAFLPLLLIWLQLVWTITLAGAVLCYSSQNIFQFSFSDDAEKISPLYSREIAVAMLTVIVKRFEAGQEPPTVDDFAGVYHLPVRLVTRSLTMLKDAGLINAVVDDETDNGPAFQPAIGTKIMTVGYVIQRLDTLGTSDFVPGFADRFSGIAKTVEASMAGNNEATNSHLTELPTP